MNKLFKELILISLGKRRAFSQNPTEEDWSRIYAEAEKQSMIGVCFAGIERLPQEQRPGMDLLMDWLGQTEYIKSQNKLVSQRAADVTRLFVEGGFRTVVLKGQGAAQLYKVSEISDGFKRIRNLSSLRTSGDIDLWVDGERESVINFMKQKGWKVGRTVIHHTDVEIFTDASTCSAQVPVEVHHIPSYAYSPFRWMKYKKWFAEQGRIQFQLLDKSLGYAYPSVGFNTVYSLLHIFRHVFHEGIGVICKF